MINLNKTLDEVIKLAKQVGKFQVEQSGKIKEFIGKSSSIDLATNVDLESERMIIDFIKKIYPDHSILAEESGSREQVSDYLWVIDPLDGTTNYINSYPIYGVSIALNYKGETVLGLVYLPKINYLYHAIKSRGAYLNNEKIEVSRTSKLIESVVATGFPYNRERKDNNAIELAKVMPNVRGIRRSGSCAFDLCCVAQGSLQAYWEITVCPWDYMAGKLIAEEAGAKVEIKESSHEGKDYILSSNGLVHNELKKLLNY